MHSLSTLATVGGLALMASKGLAAPMPRGDAQIKAERAVDPSIVAGGSHVFYPPEFHNPDIFDRKRSEAPDAQIKTARAYDWSHLSPSEVADIMCAQFDCHRGRRSVTVERSVSDEAEGDSDDNDNNDNNSVNDHIVFEQRSSGDGSLTGIPVCAATGSCNEMNQHIVFGRSLPGQKSVAVRSLDGVPVCAVTGSCNEMNQHIVFGQPTPEERSLDDRSAAPAEWHCAGPSSCWLIGKRDLA